MQHLKQIDIKKNCSNCLDEVQLTKEENSVRKPAFFALEKYKVADKLRNNRTANQSLLFSFHCYCNPSEPRCEKTGFRDFRPGPTQTGLYSHKKWLKA